MAEIAEFDIGLMGHDHKKSVGMVDRLKLGDGRATLHLSHRKVVLARTGSFLRGYVPGSVSYVADKMLNPTNLGVVKIEITPRRTTKDGIDTVELDIHASI